jgi:hypothetical protein
MGGVKMKANKITSEKGVDLGVSFILFHVSTEENPSSDIRLNEDELKTTSPSDFGRSSFPAGSTVYSVETNDPKFLRQVLWEASANTLWVPGSDGTLKSYDGLLANCILQAYNDGALR